MAPAVVSPISSIAPCRLSHTLPPPAPSVSALFAGDYRQGNRRQKHAPQDDYDFKRPPPHTALCPCSNVRAKGWAHLIDVLCRASQPTRAHARTCARAHLASHIAPVLSRPTSRQYLAISSRQYLQKTPFVLYPRHRECPIIAAASAGYKELWIQDLWGWILPVSDVSVGYAVMLFLDSVAAQSMCYACENLYLHVYHRCAAHNLVLVIISP